MGWPIDCTFCPDTLQKVKNFVFQPGGRGHPDQEAYIMVWQNLGENPPTWVKPFLLPWPLGRQHTPLSVLSVKVEKEKLKATPMAPPVWLVTEFDLFSQSRNLYSRIPKTYYF